MTSLPKHDLVAFEDYLAGERDVDIRSEYVDGKIYAMAGASRTHNTISMSFAAFIDNNLKDSCRVWQSDIKVTIQNQNQHFGYYPDIMAACEEGEADEYACTNPVLIVEVLSNSTERVDLKEKFDNYTSIPSLLEYVVVSQDVPLVRLFRRHTAWEQESYRAEETFSLESLDLDVPVNQIYQRVRKEVGLVSR